MPSISDFELLPCLPEDALEAVTVSTVAMVDDPLVNLVMPASIPDSVLYPWLVENYLFSLTKPEIHSFKVIEKATGKLVAITRWAYPHVVDDEEKQRRENEKQRRMNENTLLIDGMDLEGYSMVSKATASMEHKWLDRSDMYCLELLVTDPNYQRRGIGGMLMKPVLDMADAEGRKVYIESSAAGHPLYEKYGCKDVDFWELDVGITGEMAPRCRYVMMRDPIVNG